MLLAIEIDIRAPAIRSSWIDVACDAAIGQKQFATSWDSMSLGTISSEKPLGRSLS